MSSATSKSSQALRILVVLRALNMDRVTEGFLRCALERGHTVRVLLEQRKIGPTTEGRSLFDVLAAEFTTFSYETLPPREERWLHVASRLRAAIDYVHYFKPEFADAEILRARARDRAPWYVRLPAALGLFRVAPLRHLTDRVLRAVERRMPVSKQSLAAMEEFRPDVVAVSPLVEIGSPQGDHLRAADALGIPTVLVVASWDNLTTKGVIRDVPDTTIVWNQDQVREAVELHGLPEESLVAAGAHSHDHWFAWHPSTEGQQFAGKVGLSPDRPFLLYVCSSGFIAGAEEVAFVREWAKRLADSGDPELDGMGVLVRPHPQNFRSWEEADLGEPGRIVVWPRGGVAPTDDQSKQDYFDSLYHAKAVVGINTTALVDSAIVRRPVFTIVHDQFRSTQTGTLHFSYLARDGAGLLNVAQTWPEHFEQLGEVIRSPEANREQIDQFLLAFIRPGGLDIPAAPQAIGAIEQAAARDKQPVPKRGPLRALVGIWAGALGSLHVVFEWLNPRSLRKKQERLTKRMRKRAKQRRSSSGGDRPTLAEAGAPSPEAEARAPEAEGAAPKSPDREARDREKAAARAEKERRRAEKLRSRV